MVRITQAKVGVSARSSSWPFGAFSCSPPRFIISQLFFLSSSSSSRYKKRRARQRERATSIMACQLSKPFVCSAYNQHRPPLPNHPVRLVLFPSTRLVLFHLFFFFLSDSSRNAPFGVCSRDGQAHKIIEICSRSPSVFFYLSLFISKYKINSVFSLHGGWWLINHAAASIDSRLPFGCQWCGPHCSATFPAFCRMARPSRFPESTETKKQKQKETK